MRRFYFKNGGKGFWGGHSDEVFTSLSAEDADTQAVVFKIPESVRSSLDELHFSVEAFGYSVVLREAEHPSNLFFPRVQRTPQRTHRLERTAAAGRQVSRVPAGRAELTTRLARYPQIFQLYLQLRKGIPTGEGYAFLFYSLPLSLRESRSA